MDDLIELPEDMTSEEQNRVQQYKKNGCPNLLSVKESDIFRWFGLYMSGKSYDEIIQITKANKDVVLYISYKSGWHIKRMKHYNDLLNNLQEKMTKGKLDSTNAIVTMIAALNRYYGDKFNKFLANNDKTIIETLDTKLLSQYYKSMEMLEKLMSEHSTKPNGGDPKVNVFIENGIVSQNEKDVEITDKAAGSILKELVKAKKDAKDK